MPPEPLGSRINDFKQKEPDLHRMLLILLAQCGAFIKTTEAAGSNMFNFVFSAVTLAINPLPIYMVGEEMVEYYRKNKNRTTRNTKYNHIIAMLTFKLAENKLSPQEQKDMKDMLDSLNRMTKESRVLKNSELTENLDFLKLSYPEFTLRASIIFWNIQGLANKGKIIKTLHKYDVIILCETHIEVNNNSKVLDTLPNAYKWFHKPALRRSQMGRAMGGLLMGVKVELMQKSIEVSHPGIIAQEVEINGAKHTIIGIYRKSGLSGMKSELQKLFYRNPDRTIVLGDLNVRIGTLGNRENPRSPRSTKDAVIDSEGQEWLNYLHNHGIQILNGNKDGDWGGDITHPRCRTRNCRDTVIDYGGATETVFEEIDIFEIIKSEKSDHHALVIKWTKTDSIVEVKNEKALEIWNQDTIIKFKVDLERQLKSDESHWQNIKKIIRRFRFPVLVYESEMNLIERLDLVETKKDAWRFINRWRNLAEKEKHTDEAFMYHFINLLNGTRVKPNISEHGTEIPSNHSEPQIQEVLNAVSLLEENQEAGTDDITVNDFVYAPEVLNKCLVKMFQNQINGCSIPEEWRLTKIRPEYKMGKSDLSTSYQGIFNTNAIYKVWAYFLCTRLLKEIELKLVNTQWSLQMVRKAIDCRYILNSFIQESIPRKEMLSVLFINLKEAYESVDRSSLWDIMKEIGISQYLIGACRDIYKETPMQIGGERFYTTNGLKQDCPLSPILFAIYLGYINKDLATIRKTKKEFKLHVLYNYDDMAILGNQDDLKLAMSKVKVQDSVIGLVNLTAAHMKVVVFSKSGNTRIKMDWVWVDTPVQEEKSLTFLGSTFQSNGTLKKHTEFLANEAHRMLRLVYTMGKDKDRETQTKLFEKLVLPVVTDGCEIFGWERYECLERVQVQYYKWVLNLDWEISDQAVLVKNPSILPLHVRLANQAMEYEMEGKRRAEKSGDIHLYLAIKYIQEAFGDNIRKSYMVKYLKWTDKYEVERRGLPNYCEEAKERHIQFYKRTIMEDD